MVEKRTSNLGNALTALGLEDVFLSNGELSRFPLVERGRITNGIIAEKLRLGRWQSVIDMIYGGSGNASALFDGDRDALKAGILKSATEHYSGKGITQTTIDALVKSGESDLLFTIATSANSSYEEFTEISGHIDSSYFTDAKHGAERSQRLHDIAGKLALREKRFDSAYRHFSKIGDADSINGVFDAALDIQDRHSSRTLLEEIALSDSSQKDERLRRIVLKSISEKDRFNPLAIFELANKHGVKLSYEEKAKLQKRLADSLSRYDVEKKLGDHPDEKLLWAKRHAKDEPRAAYKIFTQQGYDGTPVVAAVQSGLSMERYKNEERALKASSVSETHLRRAYQTASFDVKVQIASHLKETKGLQELSKQAHESGDLKTAYRLWVAGGGNLGNDYITEIRTALIKDGIENRFGYMHDIDGSDTKGMVMAYDTLMETDKGKRPDNLREAYEIAITLEDEDRTQKAREAMIAINPKWAIWNFASPRGGIKDETGLDYALGFVASKYGADSVELRSLFDKYQRAQ